MEEKDKVQKVTTGAVTVKKKNRFEKLMSDFVNEDLGKIKHYIVNDVLKPYAKKMLYEIITGGADMAIYHGAPHGNSNSPVRTSIGAGRTYYRYDECSNRTKAVAPPHEERSRDMFDLDQLIFSSRQDAENVLEQMLNQIDEYKVVSIGDLYDFAGVTTHGNYTGYSYGWKDLSTAEVVRSRDGYIIKLPKAFPLD